MHTPDPIELEITLSRRDYQHYDLDMRCELPDSDTAVEPLGLQTLFLQFDHELLISLSNDPARYGQALSAMLFADPALREALSEAHTAAQRAQTSLRLRLSIATNAAELHALRWETLCDPDSPQDALLTTGQQLLFSRYLVSPDWRPVRPRVEGPMRALVAVASPADLATFALDPFDVSAEIALAQQALAPLAPVLLGGEGSRATLAAIVDQLSEGFDILYLVAHGKRVGGESFLFLEDDQGATAKVAGRDLATRIAELIERPRLVVLAACETAADDGAAVLTALGPQLAIAGVPAVLAMQGRVSVPTVRRLMPAFFSVLIETGLVDRAMSVARGVVRDAPDFWMPVLFMRLGNGRIGYRPGFTEDDHGEGVDKWAPLLRYVRNKKCTPILGPDMIEALAGGRRDLAWRLAKEFRFPLASHDREGLPQVAQYLAVVHDPAFMQDKVVEYLGEAVRARASACLPPELREADLARADSEHLRTLLDQLLRHVWEAEVAHDKAEPYRLLARLTVPIFLTADPSNLLMTALAAAGKQPRELYCPWNDFTCDLPSPFVDPDYVPSPEQPLVFRLFGSYDQSDSLVLTEDNHFDYLIGVERNRDLIPKCIREGLANGALLFLGFRPEDWAFRVFFRILMSQSGSVRRKHFPHIAVQVAPEEGRALDPRRARKYLETYFADFFAENTRISVYWGNGLDFARELSQQW
ncbi:MAG: CHAT domain-containing protein [Chloroflexales bacterium]|nr:CHAT domain-containing protein [Chloroflexales bacterium]